MTAIKSDKNYPMNGWTIKLELPDNSEYDQISAGKFVLFNVVIGIGVNIPLVALIGGYVHAGYTLQTGDIVLLEAQTTATERGLWIVGSGVTPAARLSDYPTDASCDAIKFETQYPDANGNDKFLLSYSSSVLNSIPIDYIDSPPNPNINFFNMYVPLTIAFKATANQKTYTPTTFTATTKIKVFVEGMLMTYGDDYTISSGVINFKVALPVKTPVTIFQF